MQIIEIATKVADDEVKVIYQIILKDTMVDPNKENH